jgi:hypothetical protein
MFIGVGAKTDIFCKFDKKKLVEFFGREKIKGIVVNIAT